MDVTAVERVRARLAKQLNLATSSSPSGDESSEPAGGGFELVTLQEWIRKQGGGEGDVKCSRCEAPFLRDEEASICIACGSERLSELNNATKLDYKLSISFSRFLETIHLSIEVGGSMIHQTSMDSSADQASTTSKPLQVASIHSNPVPELSRKSLSLGRNQVSPRSRQNSLDERIEFSSSTADAMANNFEDSLVKQEDKENTIFQKREIVASSQGDQVADQDVRFLENLEGSNLASGSTAEFSLKTEADAEDDWGFVMSSQSQPAGIMEDDYSMPNNLQKGVEAEESPATTQNPAYDLSFFDTLDVGCLKKYVSAQEIEADSKFWDNCTEGPNLKTQETETGMARFASNASAFTTLSDSGSDSDYNSSGTVLAKHHMKPLVEIGGDDILTMDTLPIDTFDKILDSPESQLGNQTGPIQWASDPFSSAGDMVDLFPLPLESFNPPANAPNTIAVNEVSQPQLADLAMDYSEEWGDDDFIWSQAEPAQQVSPMPDDEDSLHELSGASTSVTKDHKSGKESWQGEDFLFDESQIGILSSSTTRGSISPGDAATGSLPISGEQPLLEDDNLFKNHLESVSVTKLETDASLVYQNGELLNGFSSVTYQGEHQANHKESWLPEAFLVNQAQPVEGHRKSPGSLSQSLTFSNGVGLGSLPLSTGDAPFEDDDIFKSLHVRSASYGKAETKALPLDQSADSFKRSVSFGNLQVPTMMQSDTVEDLLSSLKLNPAPSNRFAMKSTTADQVDSSDGSKHSFPRSISFGEINLEPEDQGEDMYEFFPIQSHPMETKPMPENSSGMANHAPNFTGQVPSQLGTSMQMSTLPIGSSPSQDPFSFIQASAAQSATSQPTISSVQDVNIDDDDFEWKSADIPYVNASLVETQVAASPQISKANGNLFQWAHSSPLSFSDPTTFRTNPLTNGSTSPSFLLEGLADSPALAQTPKISNSKDAVESSSKVFLNGGWSETAESSVSMDSLSLPQSMDMPNEHTYDSDDEFSDFVSPPPPPLPSWRSQHPTSKAPLDMSWFEEQPQLSSKEGRESGLFGDLMGVRFANT